MRLPGATCLSTTSVGELKKTIDSRSALSTSATAMASTQSAEPIRNNRRFLRVIALAPGFAQPVFSTLDAQPFDQFVDLVDLGGVAHQCAARIAGGGARLVTFAQHHIGAHQPQPP